MNAWAGRAEEGTWKVRRAVLIMAIGLLVSSQARAATIGYWRMSDRPDGSTATNLHSEVNDSLVQATVVSSGGNPSYDSSVTGPWAGPTSLKISAAYEGLSTTSQSILRPTSAFTLELMLKANAESIWGAGNHWGWYSQPVMMPRAAPGVAQSWGLGIFAGGKAFARFDTTQWTNAYLVGTSFVDDNEWHHLALTYQDNGAYSTWNLYVDYQLEATTSWGALGEVTYDSVSGLLMGGNSPYPFMGSIDEVRLSDAALLPIQFLPEPSSAALLGLGSLLLWRRTRK